MGKFCEFIEKQGGPVALSKKLNVSTQCIRKWAWGEGTPTMRMTARLIRMSGGALTFEIIAQDATRNMGRRKIKC